MPGLQSALHKLSHAQQGLLLAADVVGATDWNTLPRANSWSAEHLCQIERSVLGYADRIPYLQRHMSRFWLLKNG